MIYVLMECIMHDGSYVEGVALTEEAAEAWVAEDPFLEYESQQTFRFYDTFTPIDEDED